MVKHTLALVAALLLVLAGCGQPSSHAVPHPSAQPSPCPPG